MKQSFYDKSAYFYDLPSELIAQNPVEPRDHSRLMVVNRLEQTITHHNFYEIGNFLSPNDLLIFNDTKVIPARLYGTRKTGGRVEVFLIEEVKPLIWKVLAKPAKKVRTGDQITFSSNLSLTVLEEQNEGVRLVNFHSKNDFQQSLLEVAEMPLPHYINRKAVNNLDVENYQTVYAKNLGAVAAPTAGLHFTRDLLESLKEQGIASAFLTLHVGLGTFKPVQVEDIRNHHMHEERYLLTQETADIINSTKGKGKRISVGTTACRTLESSYSDVSIDSVIPGAGRTNIFIYPGYKFRGVDSLLTNFHLPESTLLMLVSAFAGYDLIQEAYNQAVREKYRFFSYGDAMLIL